MKMTCQDNGNKRIIVKKIQNSFKCGVLLWLLQYLYLKSVALCCTVSVFVRVWNAMSVKCRAAMELMVWICCVALIIWDAVGVTWHDYSKLCTKKWEGILNNLIHRVTGLALPCDWSEWTATPCLLSYPLILTTELWKWRFFIKMRYICFTFVVLSSMRVSCTALWRVSSVWDPSRR